jgi:molecular chaperone GrpE
VTDKSTEAANDAAAQVDKATEAAGGPEPTGSGTTGGGRHSAPPDGPAKTHGDPLTDAMKGLTPGGDDEAESPAPAEQAKPLAAELASTRTALEERTRDLQRVTAEYANYRKRVDRDRALVVEQATGNVIAVLLPVLDDLDRARDHGDLTGPFAAVADQLTAALSKFGLTPFGSKGDTFDPTRHEAVAHSMSPDVSEPTCVGVMRRGYLLGERLLRPALVEVADPE